MDLRRVDPGNILVDPATVITHPRHDELSAALRERVGRIPVAEPARDLPPGVVAAPVTVDAAELTKLLRGAAGAPRVVWAWGGDEVLVHLDQIEATLVEGGVAVAVPLQEDQAGRVVIPVVFAVGTADRDAGLLMAIPASPPGPATLVDRWGEGCQALAWQLLLEVAVALAARAGSDKRSDPLHPTAIRASKGRFTIVPQARFRAAR